LISVLGLPFDTIATDRSGRMDTDRLRERLSRGDVGTVVATIGTTALGAVDPLPEILDLRKEHLFRVHADAAYGGYYTLSSGLSAETRRTFDLLGEVDSAVIDPHKHGLQPYGCGCVIFRDSSVGRFYKHDSPYTYFSSGDLHLGEISLECSRPGASAVALWATQRLLPLEPRGAFAGSLDKCRSAALRLYAIVRNDERFVAGPAPELDIVVWALHAGSVTEASMRARTVFHNAAKHQLHLALAELPLHLFDLPVSMKRDADSILCLRSVLMKPEHADWVDRIREILNTTITS
jgi:glutamate/tyrosine decarboxylase-like PLP-dependent enzyme